MASTFQTRNYIKRYSLLRRSREKEERQAKANPHLMAALAEEKLHGQRLAIRSRNISLIVIAILIAVIDPTWRVLYYEMFLLAFILIGWVQLKYAHVGQSRMELLLVFADFLLMTIVCSAPNPFQPHEVPGAFSYRFDVFIYFFVLLAGASLAYSWRTIWTIGTVVPFLWAAGCLLVYWFGNTMPEITAQLSVVYEPYPRLLDILDPNDILPDLRIQEAIVFMIVAGLIALKGYRMNQLVFRQAEITAERSNLSRYFSPNMVELLASNKEDVGAVKSQNVAVLFADISGFTKIAESLPAEEVMDLLREFHKILGNAVFENNGTLDKYLGDGIMATFGTPSTSPEDAENALKAAKQIIRDIDQHNEAMRSSDKPEFRVCVGIHYGPVILGNIGPSSKLEFAVIGDTVNVAARLESATRQLSCRIVASDELVDALPKQPDQPHRLMADFKRKKALALKGRNEKIDIWYQ